MVTTEGAVLHYAITLNTLVPSNSSLEKEFSTLANLSLDPGYLEKHLIGRSQG